MVDDRRPELDRVVEPPVCAPGSGLGRGGRRRLADRGGGRLECDTGVGWIQHRRLRGQPHGRQPERFAAAADPGLFQPADGSPGDRAGGADHARDDGQLLVGRQHARSDARGGQPRAQHPVSGHDRPGREDRLWQAARHASDHHLRDPASGVAHPVSVAAPNAFERAWRKAGCLAGRGDGPDRAVVKRLVIDLLHRWKGSARRRALKGRRCHGDRPRWSVLAVCVAGRGPARLHPPRQDRGADVRRGQDRRDRSHDRSHACRLVEGKGCVGDQRRDLYER